MGKKALALSEHIIIGALGKRNIEEFVSGSDKESSDQNESLNIFRDEAFVQAISYLNKTESYSEFFYFDNAQLGKGSSGVFRFERTDKEKIIAGNSLNSTKQKVIKEKVSLQ